MDDGLERRGYYSATQDARFGAFECKRRTGEVVVVTLVLGVDEDPPTLFPDYVDLGMVLSFVRRIRGR
jgi:hypothetical protein